jgi:Flp pilus assembly protein TadG
VSHSPQPEPPDAGFQALELAVVFPVIVLLVMLGLLAVRVSVANNEVIGAARAAARAASLAARGDQQASANAAVARSIEAGTVHCLDSPNVELRSVAAGTHQAVQVRVRCRVRLTDLGLGVDRSITATATEIEDELRA